MSTVAPRPPQVSRGCLLTGAGSALVCLLSLYGVSGLDSARVRADVEGRLNGWGFTAGVDAGDVLATWRWSLSVAAVLGVVACIFSVFAARGHRASLIGLSVAVPPLAVAAILSGWGLFPALLTVAGMVMLWLPGSRAWFVGVGGGTTSPSIVDAPRGDPMSSSAPPPGQDPYDESSRPPPPPPPPQYDQTQQIPPHDPSQQPPQHGQPPAQQGYGPPPGQQDYGQQPYAGSYGQQSYGQPSPYPQRRPGTVTAAAIIAIVMSVLTGLVWLVLGLVMVSSGDTIIDEVRSDPDVQASLDDAGITLAQFEDGIATFGVVSLVIAAVMLLAVWPAVGVLRGGGASRVILIVLSVITALIGLLFAVTGAGLGVPWVIAGGAVAALLLLGDAGAWFAGKKAGAV